VRLTTLLIAIPVIAAAGIVAVANRETVTFSVDPFTPGDPSASLSLPLYLLVFLSFFAGVLLGGLTALARRSKPSRRTPTQAVALRD
jgi:uncharacterized integral membrane protein